jgi:hypothetical protein
VLTACLSEEPLPLEVQPLEIIVASRTADEPCLLNVAMVRAGDHEVSIISERGVATLRIVDPRGLEVFQDDTSGQKIIEDENGVITIESGGEAGPLRLDPGTHEVRCQLEGSRAHTTPLLVKPARRGVAG